MNELIVCCNHLFSNRNEMEDDSVLITLLFAVDQILLSDSVDLQRPLYFLHSDTKQI